MANIWMIDDDAEFAENITTILSSEGHTVRSVLTTDGAVEALVDARPDLLVLDVMFPDDPVAGFRLARRIRQSREIRELPIIFLTAVNQEFPSDFSKEDVESRWMPVQDFVEKCGDSSVLLRKIRNLLEAGTGA